MTHPRNLADAKRATMPARIEPQLATLRRSPPDGPHWLHEIKLDGYRILCRIDRAGLSRSSAGRTSIGRDAMLRVRGLRDDIAPSVIRDGVK